MTITITTKGRINIDDDKGVQVEMNCIRPLDQIAILNEIFNMLDIPGIKLVAMDGDVKSVIGEW